MCIVGRCCTKATALVQTREDESKNAMAGQSCGLAEQMQGGHAPVQAVQPEMLGEPVLELIFALRRRSVLSLGWHKKRHARERQTHGIETLDVADVLVDVEARFGRQRGHAPAGPRDKRHAGTGSGRCSAIVCGAETSA